MSGLIVQVDVLWSGGLIVQYRQVTCLDKRERQHTYEWKGVAGFRVAYEWKPRSILRFGKGRLGRTAGPVSHCLMLCGAQRGKVLPSTHVAV